MRDIDSRNSIVTEALENLHKAEIQSLEIDKCKYEEVTLNNRKYITNKKMNDLDWADMIEDLIKKGMESSLVIQKVMELRNEYNEYITGLAATKQEKDITYKKLFELYKQEAEELYEAYLKNDDRNVEEEIFDVIQTLLNIIDYKNINIRDALLRHKLKLEARGRNFKEDIIKFLY